MLVECPLPEGKGQTKGHTVRDLQLRQTLSPHFAPGSMILLGSSTHAALGKKVCVQMLLA